MAFSRPNAIIDLSEKNRYLNHPHLLTEEQIAALAPNPAALKAGQKLASGSVWSNHGESARAMWAEVKGSGKTPYQTQIDLQNLAYKCSCPSRQFPCKHAVGLLLLKARLGSSFPSSSEPEWVAEWVNRRQAKKEKPEPSAEEEASPAAKEKKAAQKATTQANRMELIKAGAEELERWLEDLVRMGLLELPQRSPSDFRKVAARMVDAKAPGLAGYVRALQELNYSDGDRWQRSARQIIAQLYLLLRSLRKYDDHAPEWQASLRSLAGVPQSTKDLMADPQAQIVKGEWLVAGQEQTTNDDVVVERSWLVETATGQTALVLNFGTRFSPLEKTLFPAMVLDAALAYFPAIQPQRAIVKQTLATRQTCQQLPSAKANWQEIQQAEVRKLAENPFHRDGLWVLEGARLLKQREGWVVLDAEDHYRPLLPGLPEEQALQWVAVSGNVPCRAILVLCPEGVLPLGLFDQDHYTALA